MDNQHKSLKLKKVIKRMEDLEDDTRRLWIDEILHKFGEDFGFWKYKAGLEQGRLEGFIEREKVKVPQFVADHLKKSKEVGRDLQDAMNSSTILKEVDLWLYTDNNMDVFARAWLDGYTVEKEKRYLVKMKGNIYENILVYGFGVKRYFFSSMSEGNRRAKHTRKELEEDGFGEIFNSPLFEIKEVE